MRLHFHAQLIQKIFLFSWYFSLCCIVVHSITCFLFYCCWFCYHRHSFACLYFNAFRCGHLFAVKPFKQIRQNAIAIKYKYMRVHRTYTYRELRISKNKPAHALKQSATAKKTKSQKMKIHSFSMRPCIQFYIFSNDIFLFDIWMVLEFFFLLLTVSRHNLQKWISRN